MKRSALDGRVRSTDATPVRFVAVAALAGVVLGVIARLWMRWISTDPEFSWPGTIAIVAAFGVFAAGQAGAAVVRRRVGRPLVLAVTRAMSALLSVGLFGAAGAIMLPTVVFGSIAVWRPNAPRRASTSSSKG